MGVCFSFGGGLLVVCLSFVLFVALSICSMIEVIFLLASLRVCRSVLKISLSVVFSVFSQWICGHS